MTSIFTSYVHDNELTRLQKIFDTACQELDIANEPGTQHLREFLARQLIALRYSGDFDDKALVSRVTHRARLIGIGNSLR